MKIKVIVGAQYGSEGKGAVAAHLAREVDGLVAVRVAGPNAGHTVVGADGKRWPLRTVPVAAVSNPEAMLYIAPGSEIDTAVLMDEVSELDAAGYDVTNRLYISPQATLLEARHSDAETTSGIQARLGSTSKGIGAARADRIMRTARLWAEIADDFDFHRASPDMMYNYADEVQIEGTQGYALGLHAGWYPFCTSSDCTAVDFLAMAGVAAPWVHDVQVWMAIRPNPIRVAGNSGPLENETSWEDLGLDPEYTTVTHKVRRVGGWDGNLVSWAAIANGASDAHPVFGALTMADHRWPDLAGRTAPLSWSQDEWPHGLPPLFSELDRYGIKVRLLGTGPATMCEVTE